MSDVTEDLIAKQLAVSIMMRLHAKLQAIRAECNALNETYMGRVSIRFQNLNDQCDLLEDILGVPRSFPRASQEDR